jgi:hypothetical protein
MSTIKSPKSSIVVSQLSSEGKPQRVDSGYHDESTGVLRVQLKHPGRLSVQIDGIALTDKAIVQGRKPVFAKNGKNLLLLIDNEQVLELLDFYELEGVSIECSDGLLGANTELQFKEEVCTHCRFSYQQHDSHVLHYRAKCASN